MTEDGTMNSKTVELKPCPFCGSSIEPYTAHRSQETFHRHPKSGCVLSGFTIAPEDLATWNTRSAAL